MSTSEDGSAKEADRKRKNSDANKKSPKKSEGLSFFHKGLEYLKYGSRLIFWIFRDHVLDFIKEVFDLLY